jgi:putative SOS response-associated peptidase YedK
MCGGLAQAPRLVKPEARPAPRLFALVAGMPEQFNVRPMKQIGIVRADGEDLALAMARWWLTPRWSTAAKFPYSTFNARAETVQTARAFRESFKDRRAVVPLNGYFEWTEADGLKVPHYIHHRDGRLLWAAALWDRWERDGADPLESCTVIVQAAHGAAADVHDRMPAFVPDALIAEWINGAPANAARMLATMETPPLAHYPVSPRVNSARSEGADLIEPAS